MQNHISRYIRPPPLNSQMHIILIFEEKIGDPRGDLGAK
jgi:hypothetical protein